jgi:molybdopterin converting factor small subunit
MNATPVRVRYWAAAKAAAGLAEESFVGPSDLAALLDAVRARHASDPRLADVLQRCSYLVDEVSPGTRPLSEIGVAPGTTVDVLPPFAGGSRDCTAAGTAGRPDRLPPA